MQFNFISEKEPGIAWQRYHVSLKDGGALYAETNLDYFIVEPWNALSSLFLVIPAVYWAIKLKNRYRDFPFIACCIPLLFLGGMGSTLFHAFRASPFFLYLDVLPAALLSFTLGIYFWKRVSGNWWLAGGMALFIILCRLLVSSHFPSHTAANLSYALTGMFIFVPLIWLLYRTRFGGSQLIFMAILFFAISLFFRETDAWEVQVFPMGTHFLWHIFSAAGAFYLAEYLYLFESTHALKLKNKRRSKELV